MSRLFFTEYLASAVEEYMNFIPGRDEVILEVNYKIIRGRIRYGQVGAILEVAFRGYVAG